MFVTFSSIVKTNARIWCKCNQFSAVRFSRLFPDNTHFDTHICGALSGVPLSQHLNCCNILKEACCSLLLPRIRINEWSQGQTAVVVMTKINSSFLSGTVKHGISMAMPIKWKVKRVIKDIKTWIAFIHASVQEFLNPVAFSCICLLCLQREMFNKKHGIKDSVKRKMTPRLSKSWLVKNSLLCMVSCHVVFLFFILQSIIIFTICGKVSNHEINKEPMRRGKNPNDSIFQPEKNVVGKICYLQEIEDAEARGKPDT